MWSWIRRQGPAFVVACLALMVALGGSVYAAAKIDGRSVKPGSLPGNRLEKGSVDGNRIAPRSIGGGRIKPGSLTGLQVDAATLGEVAEATAADHATSARTANTAQAANFASEAGKLDGRSAGCAIGLRFFAGACWEEGVHLAAAAPGAAAACATIGGELPAALTLAAFGAQPGIALAIEGEWSGEMALVSTANTYAVATVARNGIISKALPEEIHTYRCVIPLVS